MTRANWAELVQAHDEFNLSLDYLESSEIHMDSPENGEEHSRSGFHHVYILDNESMPGLFKVGFTTNPVGFRMKELYSTGVPTPFRVVAVLDVPESKKGTYAKIVERTAHRLLDKYRVSGSREFFRTNEERVTVAVQKALVLHPDILRKRNKTPKYQEIDYYTGLTN